MEKKIRQKPRGIKQKSVIRSIPIHIDKELQKLGDGDWKKGLVDAIKISKVIKEDPAPIIKHDLDVLLSDILHHYGGNHYGHMTNLPSVILPGLKTGCFKWNIMKQYNKSLKEFDKDAKE